MANLLEELQNQILQLQQQLHGQSFVSSSVSHATGSLLDSKHLDGSNNNEWEFLMKNFLIDARLWHCIEPREGQVIDPDLDKRTLAKMNLSLKPSVAKITKRCETAVGAWNSLQRIQKHSNDKDVFKYIQYKV